MKALYFLQGKWLTECTFPDQERPGTTFEQNLYFVTFAVAFAFAVILWCE